MSKGILTEYILNKLLRNDELLEHLNEEEIINIRKKCIGKIPRKISSSSQIRPFISQMLNEICEERTGLFIMFKDMVINKVCDFIDYIIKRRQELNEKKIKFKKSTLKKGSKCNNKKTNL